MHPIQVYITKDQDTGLFVALDSLARDLPIVSGYDSTLDTACDCYMGMIQSHLIDIDERGGDPLKGLYLDGNRVVELPLSELEQKARESHEGISLVKYGNKKTFSLPGSEDNVQVTFYADRTLLQN
ncbi:hypothetical protein HOD05_00745 [Candidatus Woesearchaeota archaeon]|jgi:hypothetical protein|nr:hypothetical protein [Candidatus Woesearchaeota archaeon]MBT4150934.1 hypothetical protein [Candidatus Woesearchaeota archaeon]MBT4247091.1 hypothetical protein [Candidatus Woesearchaeota archaeon]MBT4433724.1 hypothetical protein [Candidatus Woesearchaeota archaeon]